MSHTLHLWEMEDLAYRRCLDNYYLHERPLPEDPEQVAKLIRMREHLPDVKQVLNTDLWLQLDELIQKHEVEWSWVKGHSGHVENEIADQLANQGIDELH